jgi:DNA-binding response OmpR family regulator
MPTPVILVIDDDKLFRWAVTKVLARAGYRVHEAVTAKDGLAAIQDGRPDLVLLDIGLPDLDGFTVLQSVREIRPDLPVLMVSAVPAAEAGQRALGFGACGYLEKSEDWTLLLAAVSQGLQRAMPPGQVSE